MLRKTRRFFAFACFIFITLLFLDFSGSIHTWFGWLAKIQFLPALLALNAGVVVFLILMTLLLGRVYCSVICPLGVFQDVISWIAGKRKKNRFRYSPALHWMRYGILVVFIAVLLSGFGAIAALLAPYSAYGRMVSNLLSPLYQWGNNLLAGWAERFDSYAFYSVDVWLKGGITLGVAILTFVILFLLAWRNGRTYCNTVCPVGTVLGLLSRYAYFRPSIDTEKCNGCGLCARNCKASCINSKEHKIDYSRCVACMDCLEKCHQGAITYTHPRKVAKTVSEKPVNQARRNFLAITSLFATTTILKAQEKKVDGGLALIEEKKVPKRHTPLTPPGSLSIRNFAQHCTACQLCVSVCPNQVLRPASALTRLMQPEMSYERGYCRPECTKCSEVCPAGAILPITTADKSSVQIGHAVYVYENCVINTDGVECGNCARHCPAGAIQMLPSIAGDPESLKLPVVNTERCIGCGACENLCPARPFSAIYVEGHENHRTV